MTWTFINISKVSFIIFSASFHTNTHMHVADVKPSHRQTQKKCKLNKMCLKIKNLLKIWVSTKEQNVGDDRR